MREVNKIAESLFEKIRDRFEDVSLGDENAKATQDPEKARFFNFDYVVDGRNHGNITISIIDEMTLKVYFSKNVSHKLEDEERKKWYLFLKELREFAKRNMLSFEPRDITRNTLKYRDIQQQSKADSTYSKDEVVSEGRLHGTSRSSYQECGPVKIIVRHSDRVNPEIRGDRARHIRSIYLETHEGERFKLPMNNLRYARAMARHVSEGGCLTDDLGKHITDIAEECNKLRPFKSAMRRRTFEDSETQQMVEAAFEYHGLLNNTLKRMSGRKGYQQCKEAFKQDDTLMDDFDVDSMRERFVRKTYNDATDQALPIVQKAYQMKKQNKFSQQFESWADNVAESWMPDYDDLLEVLGDELPVGVDAINAINALEGTSVSKNEMFDDLVEELLVLAEQDPDEDARDTILGWMQNEMPVEYQQLMNDIGDADTADEYGASTMDEPNVNEGEYDENTYDDDNVEAIQTAILRRILGNISQHGELLRAVGPDGVMNAARDVAYSHSPVDELGSSDISIMVREVYQEAGVEYPEMNEEYTPRQEQPLKYKKEAPSKKRGREKYYDYLSKTLGEGRVKEVATDIEELSNKQFYAKYKMSKEDMKAKLAEGQGDDYVNKDEKLKRAGAKELSTWDKIKMMPRQAKAMAKGDSEDDLVNYNQSKARLEETSDEAKLERYHELIKQGMDPDDAEVEVFNDEGDEDHGLAEMRRLAGIN